MLFSFTCYSGNHNHDATLQQITVSIEPKEDEAKQIISEDNIIRKKEVVLDNQKSILNVESAPEIIFNKKIIFLLEKFRKSPDDLELIKELSANEKALLQYARKQLENTASKLDVQVVIEALSLINSEEVASLFISTNGKVIDYAKLDVNILVYLRELPESESINTYFDLMLKTYSKDLSSLRNILLSMSLYDSSITAKWASYYRSPGINSETRYLGLYLASMLGKDETLQRWILEALFAKNKPPAYQHYYLLVALSRQMDDGEFYDFLSRSYVNKNIISSVKMERNFYQGENKLRLQLAPTLINSSYPDQRNAAISFLLKEQGFEKTWRQLNQQQRLSAIRLSYKLGVPIVSPYIPESEDNHYLWYILLLVIILLVVFRLKGKILKV